LAAPRVSVVAKTAVCRDWFAVGAAGVPKDPTRAPVLVKVFVNVWAVRLVLFRILNISARNCIFSFSPHRFWFLNTEKSKSRKILAGRPLLPRNERESAAVAAYRSSKESPAHFRLREAQDRDIPALASSAFRLYKPSRREREKPAAAWKAVLAATAPTVCGLQMRTLPAALCLPFLKNILEPIQKLPHR
jgi:hypothetical protein